MHEDRICGICTGLVSVVTRDPDEVLTGGRSFSQGLTRLSFPVMRAVITVI